MTNKTTAGPEPDIAAGRLTAEAYDVNFEISVREPLDTKRAPVESSRCYFCYDAPCIEACPTAIDIPSFIRKIQTGNVKGAAVTILEAQHHGRHLRAGLPDRGAVRAGLRARRRRSTSR